MLQRLLAERFKLRARREVKQTDTYVLTVGKGGLKLEPASDAPAASPSGPQTVALGNAGTSPTPPSDGFHLLDNLRPGELGFKAVGVTMARLSILVASYVQATVVDGTGLKGRYNFTFKFNSADGDPEERARHDFVPPSLFAAIERLGLKLEFRKVAVDHLVIDHIEKIPARN